MNEVEVIHPLEMLLAPYDVPRNVIDQLISETDLLKEFMENLEEIGRGVKTGERTWLIDTTDESSQPRRDDEELIEMPVYRIFATLALSGNRKQK